MILLMQKSLSGLNSNRLIMNSGTDGFCVEKISIRESTVMFKRVW